MAHSTTKKSNQNPLTNFKNHTHDIMKPNPASPYLIMSFSHPKNGDILHLLKEHVMEYRHCSAQYFRHFGRIANVRNDAYGKSVRSIG